jgi:hypothetical protein
MWQFANCCVDWMPASMTCFAAGLSSETFQIGVCCHTAIPVAPSPRGRSLSINAVELSNQLSVSHNSERHSRHIPAHQLFGMPEHRRAFAIHLAFSLAHSGHWINELLINVRPLIWFTVTQSAANLFALLRLNRYQLAPNNLRAWPPPHSQHLRAGLWVAPADCADIHSLKMIKALANFF